MPATLKPAPVRHSNEQIRRVLERRGGGSWGRPPSLAQRWLILTLDADPEHPGLLRLGVEDMSGDLHADTYQEHTQQTIVYRRERDTLDARQAAGDGPFHAEQTFAERAPLIVVQLHLADTPREPSRQELIVGQELIVSSRYPRADVFLRAPGGHLRALVDHAPLGV